MTDIFDTLEPDTADVVKSLGWLAAEKGLDLPTLPENCLSRLIEYVPSSTFATGSFLLPLLSQHYLVRALTEAAWPDAGMALRYVENGRWAFWQVLLVGRVNLVSVDIRMSLSQPEAPLAEANYANLCLSAHLATEQQLSRYLTSGLQNAGEIANAFFYGNADGGAINEVYRTYTVGTGLGPKHPHAGIFLPKAANVPTEEMIIYP